MAEIYEQLRALELELKIRELHQRERWEARKVSSLFGRLIITNLIWMNGAAASSVPVIASFMGIASLPWREKQALLFWPSAAFAFGLVCASLCAIAAHSIYLKRSDKARYEQDTEVSAFRAAYPACAKNPDFKPAESETAECVGESQRAIAWAFVAAQFLGWMSLAGLLTGWFWILQAEAPHVPSH